jgi:vancomycin resistance protein YoaR
LPGPVYTSARSRRRKRARVRLLWQWSVLVVSLLVVSGTALGLAFAGSPERLPEGTTIAGIDVAGLTPGDARRMLERRAREREHSPVTFTAAGRRWRVKPAAIIDETDWGAAVEAARREGEGFGPFRGLRRLEVRVFGADVAPRTRVYDEALEYKINQFKQALGRPRTEPSLRLRGLEPEIVRGKTGIVLDRDAAAHVVARALVGFSRAPVALPVRADAPRLSARALVEPQARVRTILSAPVELSYGPGGWRLPRWRLATLLQLPAKGSTAVRIGGAEASRYLERLRKTVDKPAQDASFAISDNNKVRVVPAKSGRALDAEATARALLAAALRPTNRVASLRVRRQPAEVTTSEARGMGITGLVGAYETIYGGEPNRIHNVRLVARLIDGKLIAPGATFSFNDTTGERSEDKGFREAPVIINGELQTGLGGGVCQVSTTVFNAAYEAGLSIENRTNHALYISHYPLGRDATVNYPDTDLRFTNDTGRWLLVRTFVGSSSLTVALYGKPVNRRVQSEAAPLRVTGPAPVRRVPDPTMFVGTTALMEGGEPSRSTSVRRRVFDASGKALYDHTWYSSYRGEARVIKYGTKPRPKPEEKKKKKPPPPPPPPPPADPPPPPVEPGGAPLP